jgi:hypothetical protein
MAKMKPSDPAYWMLEEGLKDPSKRSVPTVHNKDCYICNDIEYMLMGLPLCYDCPICGAHVPADDTVCDNGHDVIEYYTEMEDNVTYESGE